MLTFRVYLKTKHFLIVGFLGCMLAVLLILFNAYISDSATLTAARVTNTVDNNYMQYIFRTKNGEEIEGIADADCTYISAGDTIMVRYMKNNPQKNVPNFYEEIFEKELTLLACSLMIFFFGIGKFYVNHLFKNNREAIENELFAINLSEKKAEIMKRVKLSIHSLVALGGCFSVGLGVDSIISDHSVENICGSLFFIIIGLLCIGNSLYIFVKSKEKKL